MENQLNHIKFVKNNLKEIGFTIKNNICYKINNDVLFVLSFHKRADGIFNTELGISLNPNNKPSIKNMDILESPAIGVNLNKEDVSKDYDKAILTFILNWFKERDSVVNIQNLYKSGKSLGYFVNPEIRKILQK